MEYPNDTLYTFPVRDLFGDDDEKIIGHVTVEGCQREGGLGLGADLAREEAVRKAEKEFDILLADCGAEFEHNWTWDYIDADNPFGGH